MNGGKGFLARWSRRKRVAAATEEGAAPPPVASRQPTLGDHPGDSSAASSNRLSNLPSAQNESLFDLGALPSIESIAADTDIRGFLAQGVPTEVAREALRRAWVADPKVRDFVGLADYDWDFNAPGSMAGFGALEMSDDLRRIAAAIIRPAPAPEAPNGTVDGDVPSRAAVGERISAPIAVQGGPAEAEAPQRDVGSDHGPSLAAQVSLETEKSQLVVRRRHGGALPKLPASS